MSLLASELRLGNLIQDNIDGEILTVTLLGDRDEYNDVDGIHLTEDWLLRMSVNKRESGAFEFGSFEIVRLNSDPTEWGIYFNDEWLGIVIDKVHDFQNAHKILTGLELEIKP